MKTLANQTAFGAAFLLFGFVAQIAAAAPPVMTQTAIVRYADLNLDNPAGAAALYGRIRTTAAKVCGPADGNSLKARAQFRACYRSAVSKAVADVNRPLLTALHAGHGGTGFSRVASGR